MVGQSRVSFLVVSSLVLAASWSTPLAASAQTRVVVLGVRSVEGDDDFARNLTGALRNEASRVEGWAVSDREVTLAQMALIHGCDEPNPACMAQIADSLEANRVLYGQVRRTSVGDRYDFSINLHLFNAESDEIEHSIADTIPGIRRDIDDLREPSRRYVAALSGAPRVGTIVVTVNVPGAEVYIDDTPVGTADANGRLVVHNVQAGSRAVRIVAEGHRGFRSTVSVEAYGESSFEAELAQGDPGMQRSEAGVQGGGVDVDLAFGVALTLIGVGLAGAWIGSWAHLKFGIESDDGLVNTEDWGDAQRLFTAPGQPGGVENFCQETQTRTGNPVPGYVRDLCSQAELFEVLPFVFGISAAVFGGVGLYLLIRSALSGGEARSDAFLLEPSFGPNGGYLGARLSF